MGRGNDEKANGPSPRRLETSVMPNMPPPEVKEFRPGYKEGRRWPPPVPSGRNINILPMIASTVVEEKEEETVQETMRRVIEKDISEFSGTDEIHYYFKSNHEGLEITYPDGAREEFIISEESLSSQLTQADGRKKEHTYLQFPDDFYLDPYEGQDPVHIERKAMREEMKRQEEEFLASPEYQEMQDELFDVVDSKEEWERRAKEGTLNPDGKMTVIRVSDEDAEKIMEDQQRIEQGLPPIHATPPKPGERPPWESWEEEEEDSSL